MKTLHHRINNLVGQLLGAARMIDDGQDCHQVLVQLKAADKALEKLTAAYIKQNIQSCLPPSSKKNEDKINGLIDRLISP